MRTSIKINLLYVLLVFFSCEKKIYQIPDREDIVSALAEKVSQDQALAFQGLADREAWSANYTSSALTKGLVSDTAQIDSTKFGRIITQITDTIYHFDIGWDSAYVDVRYHFKGHLKIVRKKKSYIDTTFHDTTNVRIDSSYNNTLGIWQYDTSYTIITLADTIDSNLITLDTLQKSMAHVSWQRAFFLRLKNSNNPAKDWQLKAVTPMLVTSQNSGLEIASVEMTINGKPDHLTLRKNNFQNTFFTRDSLPLLFKNNVIDFAVQVNNTAPFSQTPGEIILIHLGRGINVNKQRWALTDRDNDGLHTGRIIPSMYGKNVFPLYIDLIDYRSLLISTEDYASELWMIPLRIPADL